MTATKRVTLVVEGDEIDGTGIIIMRGALHLPEEAVSISWDDKLLGSADDFERDEKTGEIFANVTIADDNFPFELFNFGITGGEIEWFEDEKVPQFKFVASSKIVHIAAVPN